MTRLIAAALVLLGQSCIGGLAAEPAVERGEALAASLCAQCHAISDDAESPRTDAPEFPRLGQRIDLDMFMDRLQQGLTSGHPDMPTFRFTRDDARALVAYLRSVQAP